VAHWDQSDNPNSYWNSVVDARSATVDAETSLRGETLISVESDGSQQQADLLIYLDTQPESFFPLLRHLTPIEQEQLLSYYVIGATQTRLAPLWKSTQTLTSYFLRRATKTYCATLVFGPEIRQEQIENVLQAAGLEEQMIAAALGPKGPKELLAPMSVIFHDYLKCRSFKEVAERHHLHRADMRRKMNSVVRQLNENPDGTPAAGKSQEHLALAAVLMGAMDGANPVGTGRNRRSRRKGDDVAISDPTVVGQFTVSMTDSNVKSMFVSAANR
jgi:hypothetical protein